jgi:hypothetical protein
VGMLRRGQRAADGARARTRRSAAQASPAEHAHVSAALLRRRIARTSSTVRSTSACVAPSAQSPAITSASAIMLSRLELSRSLMSSAIRVVMSCADSLPAPCSTPVTES